MESQVVVPPWGRHPGPWVNEGSLSRRSERPIFQGDQNGEKEEGEEKVTEWTGFVREDIVTVCVLFHFHSFLKCLFIGLHQVSGATRGAFHCSTRASGAWAQWLQRSGLVSLQRMGS